MNRLVGIGLVVGLLALLAWLWLRPAPPEPEPEAPASRFDLAFARELASLSQLPAYRERLAGLPPEELRGAIQGLAAKGMRRLPDDRLQVRTRIVGRMLEGLDIETCAAMATGRQNATVHDAAVLVLDPASLDEWVALSFEAARAELEGVSTPRPSYAEIQLALRTVGERLPEAEATRLSQALANLADAPPAEACWAARNLYRIVPELGPPARETLARELAGP